MPRQINGSVGVSFSGELPPDFSELQGHSGGLAL
jgi:hypothetical protein